VFVVPHAIDSNDPSEFDVDDDVVTTTTRNSCSASRVSHTRFDREESLGLPLGLYRYRSLRRLSVAAYIVDIVDVVDVATKITRFSVDSATASLLRVYRSRRGRESGTERDRKDGAKRRLFCTLGERSRQRNEKGSLVRAIDVKRFSFNLVPLRVQGVSSGTNRSRPLRDPTKGQERSIARDRLKARCFRC